MSSSRKVGYLCGLVAYLWWGLVPLYFDAVKAVPAREILAHRIVWSIPLMLGLTAFTGGWRSLHTALTSRRTLLTMLLSGTLLAVNWYLYIQATVTQHIAEAGLGYYMMPLVNAFFGSVFLGEKLRPAQWPALGMIVIGVSIPFVAKLEFTWLAVALPVTFGFYGLVRKVAAVDSITGLTLETFLLGIPSAIYIGYLSANGEGHFEMSRDISLLLMFGGVMTVVPLLTYILSLRRLPLIALSFIQFLSPTMQMFLAYYYFQEPITWDRFAATVCVWIAVVIFIVDAIVASRQERKINERRAANVSEPVHSASFD